MGRLFLPCPSCLAERSGLEHGTGRKGGPSWLVDRNEWADILRNALQAQGAKIGKKGL